jgi:hypothetical protein
MKRVILIIIGLYLVIGTILVSTYKENSKKINYFTLKQNYSRLMLEEELLVVSLFIDRDDSFITEKSMIDSALLRNDESEIAVAITSVKLSDEDIQYKDKSYYLYTLNIDFTEVYVTNMDLVIEECYLDILYNNEELISLYIGDVALSFRDEINSDNLDFVHMTGIVNVIDGKKYLVGICLKLDNLTLQTITINDIYTNSDLLKFDLNNSFISNEAIVDNPASTDLFGEYNHLGDKEEGVIYFDDSYYYVIPVVYQEMYQKIYRFPLTIEYRLYNQDYKLEIDDYLFFDEFIRLDDYVDEIREYQYFYPESN